MLAIIPYNTPMAIVEGIPGIRRITKRTPDAPIERKETAAKLSVRPLHEADIPAVVGLLHKSLDATPDSVLPASEKLSHKTRRTAEFYHDALSNPDYHRMYTATNADGQIVGTLETTRFEVEGQNIGYVNWVVTDPDARKGGIAAELYRNFEAEAKEEGLTFLLANVHHSNEPSLRLHRATGFRRTPYLQKPADANWYVKQINPLDKDTEISITENAFLPPAAQYAIDTIQDALMDRQLGDMDVCEQDAVKEGERLISVATPDDRTRRKVEVLFDAASDAITSDPDLSKDETVDSIKKAVFKRAESITR